MFAKRLSQLQSQRKLVLMLVLGLLLAQWLVITHIHEHAGNTYDSLCAICVTGEHFSHVLNNSPLIITPQFFQQFNLYISNDAVLQQSVLAFHSRAPPSFFNHY